LAFKRRTNAKIMPRSQNSQLHFFVPFNSGTDLFLAVFQWIAKP